jgi:BirA family biotin operon repressor/biotin-[acetyl-CoA-carboxylase] ligase
MHLKSIHLERTVSTNAYLAERVRNGTERKGVVVRADYQENGRGQSGRTWYSDPGMNLLVSFLLFPEFLSARDQFQLSRVASLALCDMLEGLGLETVIKWPNDILCGGRKIAGILVENGILGQSVSHTIIGIGLNLNQDHFPEFPMPATSVVMEGRPVTDPADASVKLVDTVSKRFMQLEKGEAGLLEKEYLKKLFMLNLPGRYLLEGKEISGIIRGLSPYGELLLETGGAIAPCSFQQIGYIMPQP